MLLNKHKRKIFLGWFDSGTDWNFYPWSQKASWMDQFGSRIFDACDKITQLLIRINFIITGVNLQARTPEWVAISFSNAWKWKVKVRSLSHVQLFGDSMDCIAYQTPPSMGLPRQEYWSGLPLSSPVILLRRVKTS